MKEKKCCEKICLSAPHVASGPLPPSGRARLRASSASASVPHRSPRSPPLLERLGRAPSREMVWMVGRRATWAGSGMTLGADPAAEDMAAPWAGGGRTGGAHGEDLEAYKEEGAVQAVHVLGSAPTHAKSNPQHWCSYHKILSAQCSSK